MAKDPICGMTVDEAAALHAERDGQTFYFCSNHCLEKFWGLRPKRPAWCATTARKTMCRYRMSRLATKLACYAVEAALKGETGKLVGEVRGEFALTPFKESVETKKPIDPYLKKIARVLAT